MFLEFLEIQFYTTSGPLPPLGNKTTWIHGHSNCHICTSHFPIPHQGAERRVRVLTEEDPNCDKDIVKADGIQKPERGPAVVHACV